MEEIDPEALRLLEGIAETCKNPVLRERAKRQFDLAHKGVKPPPIREYLDSAFMMIEDDIAAKLTKFGWEFNRGPNDWHGEQEPTPWFAETDAILLVQCHAIAIVPHAHVSDIKLYACTNTDEARQDPPPPTRRVQFNALPDHVREAITDYLEKTNSTDWLEGLDTVLTDETVQPERFETTCPNCGESLKIRYEYIGKRGRCKYCKEKFTVPEPTSA